MAPTAWLQLSPQAPEVGFSRRFLWAGDVSGGANLGAGDNLAFDEAGGHRRPTMATQGGYGDGHAETRSG